MAVQDLIFKASAPNVDVLKAIGTDLLMNISNPLMMMDRTNIVSFQDINLLFVNDPPEPTGVGADKQRDTVVYSFLHGYNRIPAVWMLGRVLGGSIAGVPFNDYEQEGALLKTTNIGDGALLLCDADTSRVYVSIRKFIDTSLFGVPNDITGISIKLRIYVFANDVGV